MALTDDQCKDAARDWVTKMFVEARATATVHLDEIKAAVAAIDSWLDDNSASYNAALPQPFKGRTTIKQKSALLAYVALKKTDVI